MGAGYHGGFGNTRGSREHESKSKQNIPISQKSDLRYSKKKTEGYLLNLDHPKGYSKAKFMKEVLGYTKEDSKLFHNSVTEAIIGKTPLSTEETKYGLKHTYHTEIIGKNNKKLSANVVVIIQKDKGRTIYKIVTVYPDKKGD
jgi:hypothetical protein